MKQKEKEILLKTFCSLLLYNGYFSHCNKIHRLKTIELDEKDTINNKYPVEICYPYLRPMLSMTEEEEWKYNYIKENHTNWEAYDYLNSIHIDYRGLIPMGLALEAPEGMYDIK